MGLQTPWAVAARNGVAPLSVGRNQPRLECLRPPHSRRDSIGVASHENDGLLSTKIGSQSRVGDLGFNQDLVFREDSGHAQLASEEPVAGLGGSPRQDSAYRSVIGDQPGESVFVVTCWTAAESDRNGSGVSPIDVAYDLNVLEGPDPAVVLAVDAIRATREGDRSGRCAAYVGVVLDESETGATPSRESGAQSGDGGAVWTPFPDAGLRSQRLSSVSSLRNPPQTKRSSP